MSSFLGLLLPETPLVRLNSHLIALILRQAEESVNPQVVCCEIGKYKMLWLKVLRRKK